MFKELNNLKSENNIFKKDLMNILHGLAKTISIHDIILASTLLREEGKYVQAKYREQYLEIYIKYFIMRVKDVKEDKTDYSEEIDNKKDFPTAINLLESQFHEKKTYIDENEKFTVIYTIIGLYTTFILNEPIHPIGTPFPGSLKVTYENETYFCPVKDKQSETPQAVCKFCIAKQSEL
ncbi:MAG: DUF2115 domain-containing protein [Methanobrevibacter sp.]|nr:DUF2115 domain-containing protein [Methanobrevibacter sp.]